MNFRTFWMTSCCLSFSNVLGFFALHVLYLLSSKTFGLHMLLFSRNQPGDVKDSTVE
jgi:hypothetical protein